jgi:hypothetical protein
MATCSPRLSLELSLARPRIKPQPANAGTIVSKVSADDFDQGCLPIDFPGRPDYDGEQEEKPDKNGFSD